MRSLALVGVLVMGHSLFAADPVFSGPQVGEPITPFQATGVLGKLEGKDVTVGDHQGPQLIIFVHQLTRPSIGLVRLVSNYAATKKFQTLKPNLVFLASDRTETADRIRRARRALPEKVMPLISKDGAEGPGAYGLNRKMTLRVLVADKGKVTANFPLVQPSVQADGPKIGHALVKAIGGDKQPSLAEMGLEPREMMARKRNAPRDADVEAIYGRLMRPVIRARSKEDVDKAAAAVEAMAKKNKAFRNRVGNAAGRIAASDRLKNYGTEDAQEYIKKWAKLYAPKQDAGNASQTDAEKGAKRSDAGKASAGKAGEKKRSAAETTSEKSGQE